MNTKKYDIILTDMAKSELEEIYQYIFNNLKEPKIADKLMEKIETEILSLEISPYRCMEIPIKLKNQVYRRLVVENYVVLYRFIEEEKKVVIFKILYGGRNYLE